MYALYIGNKNYSSWSLRPWVLMRELGIAFEERLVPFEQGSSFDKFRAFSPTGRVPCLVDGDVTVWDSLGITEYLAERHDGVWPRDAKARAWARSATAEMHSGFSTLRERCAMSCGIRVRLHDMPPALVGDIRRLNELWSEGLTRFGGPFLGGERFSAVDAFFAPVAFRQQTYGLVFEPKPSAYLQRLRDLASMRSWYADALAETWREADHDDWTRKTGTWIEDLRASA
jgi:glutathione S-transferase